MAYIKKTKYTVVNDDDLKQEMLEDLYEVEGLNPIKARDLVFYPRPMSLVRWSVYLTPAQISKYLVAVDEVSSNIKNVEIDIEDMGI